MSSSTDLLGGRYRLLQRIATGGMGVVWRAVDTALDRHVAIKLIRPEYADDPIFRDRLRGEARAVAAIRSPHVVRIFDVGEQPDRFGGTRSYLVMELVDGDPLSHRLRGSGPLAPATVAAIVGQTALALAAAHARGIVHRDVKPANLLLDAVDRLTVIDFGIAKAADAVSLTATNALLGSVHYLSPEQIDGQGATAASDIYALGVVAYRCLAGRPPFEAAGDIAVALAHREQPVPELPSGVPGGCAALVRQMLAKAPGDRPSAADIVARTSRLAEDTASMVPADGVRGAVATGGPATTQLIATDATGRTAGHPARQHRSLALVAAGSVAATAVALLLGAADGRGTDVAPAAPAVSVHSHSSPSSASPSVSPSARMPARTTRSSGAHHVLTPHVAAPSHNPAPAAARPKPSAQKQKSKPPAPKHKSPAPKHKPEPPAPKHKSPSPKHKLPPPKQKSKPPKPKRPAR